MPMDLDINLIYLDFCYIQIYLDFCFIQIYLDGMNGCEDHFVCGDRDGEKLLAEEFENIQCQLSFVNKSSVVNW